MRVVVFGATGRTGRQVLPRLAAAGHEAVVYGRRAPDGWAGPAVIGAAGDRAAVASVLAGADAALSCLASTKTVQACLPTTEAVIAAAPPGFRYVVIGGAAVDAPGDAKAIPDRIVSWLARTLAGPIIAERQAELAALQASRLDWTFLRPPQLKDGPGTGRWRLTFDTPAAISIDRADLAAAMVAALTDPALSRRAPFVARG
ncbi:MAG: NAD(P)-dependent oxidoreductase [Gemmobacter sp.]